MHGARLRRVKAWLAREADEKAWKAKRSSPRRHLEPSERQRLRCGLLDVTCGSVYKVYSCPIRRGQRCPKRHSKRKSGDMTRIGRVLSPQKAKRVISCIMSIPRNSVFTCKLQRIIFLFVSQTFLLLKRLQGFLRSDSVVFKNKKKNIFCSEIIGLLLTSARGTRVYTALKRALERVPLNFGARLSADNFFN